MRANQWKAILVLIDAMDRYLPAIGVVAQLAFGSILAPVQISVTILALVGSISEFQIGMAVTASHGCMASAKRKPRLRMVEFDLALDYLPIRGCVAGCAGHVEFAVRALCGCNRLYGLRMQGASAHPEGGR
jgi:hypothetical protein